jgi:predicted acylesterase/phospholipase RssA
MSKHEIPEKKHIHFILPGGGVNGAFQAGFIYRLMSDCRAYIEIDRIDGISVGALNGLGLLFEDPELLRNIWFSIEERADIFDSHPTNYDLWSKGSLYDSNGLRRIIDVYKNFVKTDELSKYNCVVHNSNKNCPEYIDGTNSNLWDFVIASASPPFISPYSKIGEHFYTDGGIDQVYPIDYLNADAPNNQMRLVLGYYENNDYYMFNLYRKMKATLNANVLKAHELLKMGFIKTIANPCSFNIIDFRREIIDEGFKRGEEAAISFYMDYIMI